MIGTQKEKKLSVVIPISRMAGKLDNLFESIRSSNEISYFLIHDKQDQETGPELTEFKNSLPDFDITYAEVQFKSPGMTRNAGLNLVVTRWVAFWDSDDIPNAKAFLEMIADADQCPTHPDVAIGDFEVLDSISGRSEVVHSNRKLHTRIALNPAIWRMAFVKHSLGNVHFNDFRMGEDQVFLAEYKLNSKTIFYFPKSVYTYCINNGSQLTQSTGALLDIRKSIAAMEGIIKSQTTGSLFPVILYSKLNVTLCNRQEFTEIVRTLISYLRFFSKAKATIKFSLLKAIPIVLLGKIRTIGNLL
jgi:hypothetical protein